MKFLIVAAKTGGHVFPAASIAKELIKKDHKVVFLGTGAQIEKNAFKDGIERYSTGIITTTATKITEELPQ